MPWTRCSHNDRSHRSQGSNGRCTPFRPSRAGLGTSSLRAVRTRRTALACTSTSAWQTGPERPGARAPSTQRQSTWPSPLDSQNGLPNVFRLEPATAGAPLAGSCVSSDRPQGRCKPVMAVRLARPRRHACAPARPTSPEGAALASAMGKRPRPPAPVSVLSSSLPNVVGHQPPAAWGRLAAWPCWVARKTDHTWQLA